MHFKKILDEGIVLLIVHMYANSVKCSEVLPYKTIYWRGIIDTTYVCGVYGGINIGDWRFFRKFANIKSANN